MRRVAVAWVTVLLFAGAAFAQTQNGDSYQGFHIGMVLSETFAVGGGNLEKAQAACANPPKQLSNQEREGLAKVCVKMERTLSGQPSEWEFPKQQLRLAFDKGHLIRVSDFNGVVHLQEAQTQAAVSTPVPATTPTTPSQPQPTPQARPTLADASPYVTKMNGGRSVDCTAAKVKVRFGSGRGEGYCQAVLADLTKAWENGTAPPPPAETATPSSKPWLTGNVTALGTTTGIDSANVERKVPGVAITVEDPTSLDSSGRSTTYIIFAEAIFSRTHVKFEMGDVVKVYRTGETNLINGFLMVRYESDKGQEKGELHIISRIQ